MQKSTECKPVSCKKASSPASESFAPFINRNMRKTLLNRYIEVQEEGFLETYRKLINEPYGGGSKPKVLSTTAFVYQLLHANQRVRKVFRKRL